MKLTFNNLKIISITCKLLIILFIILIAIPGYSQLGYKVIYDYGQNKEISKYLDNVDNVFQNEFGIGVNYNYQLPNSGIMLMPGIFYKLSRTKVDETVFELSRPGLEFPVKFYPFNMEGECGCPDFSLRNKYFQKHYYIILNDAMNFDFRSKTNITTIGDFSFMAGIGTGISINLSKHLVLSPTLYVNKIFSEDWDSKLLFETIENKKVSPIQYGIELKFNYLYKKK